MTEVSCFYTSMRNDEILIVFIKFENFITIHLHGCNKITIKIDMLHMIPKLYDLYVLSQLVTEDSKKLTTTDYNDRYYLNVISLYKFNYINNNYLAIDVGNKNLLLKKSPTRDTTSKKFKKFMKHINIRFENVNLFAVMASYISTNINYIINDS